MSKTRAEYLREAVNLAGWLDSDEAGEFLQIPAQPFSAYLDEMEAGCENYLLDALAAQLARQVLHPYGVWQFPIGVSVSSMDVEDPRELSRTDGPDRTWNTIKAIIDSKVLEVGSE